MLPEPGCSMQAAASCRADLPPVPPTAASCSSCPASAPSTGSQQLHEGSRKGLHLAFRVINTKLSSSYIITGKCRWYLYRDTSTATLFETKRVY